MILQRIHSHLSTLKAVELKTLAQSCGVALSGTKPILFERLNTHFVQLYGQAAAAEAVATSTPTSSKLNFDRLLPSSVLSFDLGYRNLAFVQLTRQKNIKTWQVVDLELKTFHPSTMAPLVRKFVHENIQSLFPHIGHVVIEQQRARSGGSHGIFEHTLRVNTVEALLWCALDEINHNSKVTVPMEPILRQPVDKYWQEDLELAWITAHQLQQQTTLTEDDSTKKITNKKKAAVLLVNEWLEQQTPVSCPEDLVSMFLATKKKDDLSDCLLQAAAWYRWRENSIKYLVAFQ
ncbi:ribonuclease H-like domain-containing protein [Absidia repens]|uniref:Ribonuclease H-like domain-containing protein n=1 Tax=Absidia repens TaxID=90262 RepID=A0A1X2IA48_9FUNG|nr:ribonuclease H-like domain-containing protein [Absidia repens]